MLLIKAFENVENTLSKDVFLSLLGAFFIALFAHISIPLPFTPVPLAMQPQVVLLLAIVLGGRRASFSALSFLLLGALNFPVFAGGVGGVFKIFGVTGGYLAGYVIAAYITGLIYENCKKKTSYQAFFSLLVGNVVILLCGMFILSLFIGASNAFVLGVLPFMAGDLLKILFMVKTLQWMKI